MQIKLTKLKTYIDPNGHVFRGKDNAGQPMIYEMEDEAAKLYLRLMDPQDLPLFVQSFEEVEDVEVVETQTDAPEGVVQLPEEMKEPRKKKRSVRIVPKDSEGEADTALGVEV